MARKAKGRQKLVDSTVTRKIHFFRVDVLPDIKGKVPAFSVKEILESIQKLTFEPTDPSSRYAETKVGLLCAWPESTDKKLRVRLGKRRLSDLPNMENAGTIAPLPINPDDALIETTHLQFFPDGDLLFAGMEFNFYGPRSGAFMHYCREKVPKSPHFMMRPLLRNDAAANLRNAEDVRRFHVSLHPSKADLLAAISGDLPASLKATADQFNGENCSLILKAERHKTLDGGILPAIWKMLQAVKNPSENFETLQIRGKSSATGMVETFDLLRDKLIAEEAVTKVPDRTRAVDAMSMFSGIEHAYNNLKEDLRNAVALGLDE